MLAEQEMRGVSQVCDMDVRPLCPTALPIWSVVFKVSLHPGACDEPLNPKPPTTRSLRHATPKSQVLGGPGALCLLRARRKNASIVTNTISGFLLLRGAKIQLLNSKPLIP